MYGDFEQHVCAGMVVSRWVALGRMHTRLSRLARGVWHISVRCFRGEVEFCIAQSCSSVVSEGKLSFGLSTVAAALSERGS